ncbi:MAG: hypothetical protein KGI24_06105 [Candidatus Omnitrophica bacterium]|nr:hypothetical protein [Candidatus Omnitrophota bacterium]MDE2214636.1 hypothetical protein [Candidatus Omnitrophota bacterium]MDE2231821.1 hypothetical protein [Candidatus Omnitrophota bacterium]
MKINKILLAAGMLLAGLSTARAQNVILDQNIYSYRDGGEFTAHTTPNNFLDNYAPSAILNGGFETFCVQSTVDFYPGTKYSYVLTDTESTGQKLTMGTAFLYDQFATGTLSGYDYTDAATRKADNGELQSALWAFQGQTILGGFPSISGDPYYNLAITDLGGSSAAFAPSNGAYGVDILQMYNTNGAPAQAQLVIATPEPPTILLCLFAGILLIFFNRKKMLRPAGQALR